MKKLFYVVIALCLFNSAFALNPSRDYSVKPDEYGMNYKTIKIPTDDGLQLNAWYFPSPQTSYKIIVLSGDGNGNMSDLIELAGYFISLDYSVITYDYRGFGESSDFNINKKFYVYAQFSKDLQAVLNYVKTNYANLPKVNLYGKGIGASISLCAGSSRKIDYIIADSPYSTFEGIQQRIKEKQDVDVKLPLGYNKMDMEPQYALAEKANSSLKGILYIAGGKDVLYTEKDMKELMKIRKEISKLYIAEIATSSNTMSSNKTKYFAAIKDLLRQDK